MSIFYIGFAGKAQHGKDTAAKAFKDVADSLNIVCDILPLAKDLKDMASEIWGYSYEDMYVSKPVDVRHNLQRLGTDIIRKRDNNFWISSLKRQAEIKKEELGDVDYYVLVPDIRFHNEASFIKDNNGFLFRIVRTPDTFTGVETVIDEKASKHPSEVDLDNYKKYDITVYNINTLDSFVGVIKEQSKMLLKNKKITNEALWEKL